VSVSLKIVPFGNSIVTNGILASVPPVPPLYIELTSDAVNALFAIISSSIFPCHISTRVLRPPIVHVPVAMFVEFVLEFSELPLK